MSVKILNENLKTGSFCSLYYIYGEEEYLKNYYFSQLKSKIASDFPEFNITEFNSKNFDFIDFCNAVNSYPVMCDKKIITVTDIDNSLFKKGFTEEFVSFLKKIPEFTVVVFFDSQLKNITASNPLEKAVTSAKGLCVEVKKPDVRSLVRWVDKHFKTYGKKISSDDIEYLIEISDSDMMSLDNEISKLCNYVDSDTVLRTDIDNIVTRSIDANRYEIADAFCNRNYKKIFEIVDKLYKQNIEDIVIANVFYRAFLDMWKAKLALNSSKTSQQLSTDFKMNPYAANRIIKNSKTLSLKFLEQAILLSLKLDTELKSTPFNNKDLIILYIGNIINYRENVR